MASSKRQCLMPITNVVSHEPSFRSIGLIPVAAIGKGTSAEDSHVMPRSATARRGRGKTVGRREWIGCRYASRSQCPHVGATHVCKQRMRR